MQNGSGGLPPSKYFEVAPFRTSENALLQNRMYSFSSLIKAERHCWKQNSSSHEGTDLDMNIEEGVQAVAGSFWEGWPTACRVPENKWKYPN